MHTTFANMNALTKLQLDKSDVKKRGCVIEFLRLSFTSLTNHK